MAIVIDVEASGLHVDSYPIEIAWFDYELGQSDSFLIKPASHWIYWDPVAEKIHNIDQGKLILEGLSVFEAADRLIDGLEGRTAYSDAVQFDSLWIDILMEASGNNTKVNVDSVYKLVSEDCYSKLSDYLHQSKKPHRALEDCKIIAECIQRSR